MNAKTCKRLRKEAQGVSVGMPQKGYIRKTNKDGRVIRIENHPQTTRGIYRQLKMATNVILGRA